MTIADPLVVCPSHRLHCLTDHYRPQLSVLYTDHYRPTYCLFLSQTDHYGPTCCLSLTQTDHYWPTCFLSLSQTDHYWHMCCLSLSQTDHYRPTYCLSLSQTDHYWPTYCLSLSQTDHYGPTCCLSLSAWSSDWVTSKSSSLNSSSVVSPSPPATSSPSRLFNSCFCLVSRSFWSRPTVDTHSLTKSIYLLIWDITSCKS